jgi:hypothetical protein
VQSEANSQAQWSRCVSDGAATLDCPARAVESCEEAITCGLDLCATEELQLSSDHLVVSVKAFVPSGVTDRAREAGRIDDVGEHDGA